jgi:16S rRNA (cytosine967-C5)-methyltransferase
MTSQRPKPARAVAIAALNQFDPERNYAGLILSKLLDHTDEKQRATDLVFGTTRNRAAIDTVVAQFGDCPVERIPSKLLNIIRIGAYELIYSPTTPDYSIVNEAVESAGTIAGKKQTGFVNALLRQISRHIENRQISLSDSDVRKTLPQTPLTGCKFDSDILPDPKVAPADYLSAAFSLPGWLINDWLDEFGPEKTRQICFASNRRPSIYVRPNKLKTTTEQITEKFRQAKIDFETLPGKSMVRMKAARAVTELPGFAQGLFTIQDMTASQAVKLLDPQPDWTILDLCAAPGTKTTQLAELTGDSAKIIATDINNERLEKVKENIARLGVNSVNIVPYKELLNSKFEILNSKFDCVLLDVPCSNTGVLAKRIEVRYRIRPRTITELAKTQKELIEAAAAMIKPQGKICYSTCSIQKAENSRLVKDFLQKNHNFKLESEVLILPSAEGFDHDGGYAAIISRDA